MTNLHIEDVLRMTDSDYCRRYHITKKALDAAIVELDLAADQLGYQLDQIFDAQFGRSWRWTKAQRAAYGDTWREYWEPLDSPNEGGFGC